MALSFKYAYYPTWYYITYPSVWALYRVPILASTYMYYQCPAADAPDVIYREGSEEGYTDVASFYKEVCDALQFNPFTVTKFYLTTEACEDDEIINVINSFKGNFEERNGTYNGFNPEPTGTGSLAEDLIGYCDLTSGVKGTYSFTGANFNGVDNLLSRILHYTQFTKDDGVEFDFVLWPSDAIEDGYINMDRLFKEDGKYRVLNVKLFIYKKDDKYYWYIKLHAQVSNKNVSDWLYNKFNNFELEHVYSPDNPYDDHQEDGNEGGDGDWNNDSDPVDVPELPTLDVSDIGGLNLYRVTAADVKALFTFLNSNAPGESILKWYTNPIQGIISLHVLPYPVSVIGADAVRILGLTVSGTAGYKIKQFQEWSLGSVHVDYGFGNCFLDYEPYSHCQIYLPFVGIRSLDMDEIVGQTITIKYQFDNISGACIAFILINGAVRYAFAGSCAIGIPINQQNWGQSYIAAATSAAGALAGGVGGAVNALSQGASTAGIAAEGIMGAVNGSGGIGAIQKPTVSRSGSITGAASALGVPYPYLIIERPEKAKVANPAPVMGLACGRTLSLGSLSGYNIIEKVHLSGIPATGSELDEIEKLLYQGVIF